VRPNKFTKLATSGKSALYRVDLPETHIKYDYAPLLLDLHGSRMEIGYDYAALLHEQTEFTFRTFLNSAFPTESEQLILNTFVDYVWDSWLSKNTPQQFLDELEGMRKWYRDNNQSSEMSVAEISTRFYTLANMPADGPNIIAALEQEFEQGWPQWLKDIVNELIKILERLVHSCDAYGVWGPRTLNGNIFSSRNLDYNSNTGINRYKLVTMFHITEKNKKIPTYATIGFSFGPGALAGINAFGITTSEMNLDNSETTFTGLPFPLRLRDVLENSNDLNSAMKIWNSTKNTNSFNFLIASAADNSAVALETIKDFTAVFGANSDVERNATFFCGKTDCKGWTKQTGYVHIGKPLPHAVWRTNHGFNPRVMRTQEPLFNGTVFRYDIMHNLFVELEQAGQLISDEEAIGIVATLGTKGDNFFTCDQKLDGDNVMSIAYAPGYRSSANPLGYFYVAWESGLRETWRPAACSPFVYFDLNQWK